MTMIFEFAGNAEDCSKQNRVMTAVKMLNGTLQCERFSVYCRFLRAYFAAHEKNLDIEGHKVDCLKTPVFVSSCRAGH